MDVRSQIAMVFHLDKCIGCHTCSVACKNIWTDREGTEYMWWNNVETKPGTGYPTKWEDQESYRGGWETDGKKLSLRSTGKARIIPNIFHNPSQPSIDEEQGQTTPVEPEPESTDQPPTKPRVIRKLPNQKGLPEGAVRLYCESCKESFVSAAPDESPSCPKCHSDSKDEETES